MAEEIILAIPSQYDYQHSIQVIQRGQQDLTNHITENIFTRLYKINNRLLLITVKPIGSSSSKKSYRKLKIQLLHGEAQKEEILKLMHLTLGLDDPLLKIPNQDSRLNSSWGIAVPGYPSLFEALVQTLLSQLVSVSAANQMRHRFILAFGEKLTYQDKVYYAFPTPQHVICHTESDLKIIGTSLMKIRAILAIAKAFIDNFEDRLNQVSRVEQHQLLQSLYGVGRWTIDWVMLRALRRFDVIPGEDLTVRKAFTWWSNSSTLLSSQEVRVCAHNLMPYTGAVIYRILWAYLKYLQTR